MLWWHVNPGCISQDVLSLDRTFRCRISGSLLDSLGAAAVWKTNSSALHLAPAVFVKTTAALKWFYSLMVSHFEVKSSADL